MLKLGDIIGIKYSFIGVVTGFQPERSLINVYVLLATRNSGWVPTDELELPEDRISRAEEWTMEHMHFDIFSTLPRFERFKGKDPTGKPLKPLIKQVKIPKHIRRIIELPL